MARELSGLANTGILKYSFLTELSIWKQFAPFNYIITNNSNIGVRYIPNIGSQVVPSGARNNHKRSWLPSVYSSYTS